jgi:hypothetical protein
MIVEIKRIAAGGSTCNVSTIHAIEGTNKKVKTILGTIAKQQK